MIATALTQTGRLMILETPLDPDKLLITSFGGVESMSGLFRYDIEMIAEKSDAPSIAAEELIGEKFTVRL